MKNEWKIIECNKYTGGKWSPQLLERLESSFIYKGIADKILFCKKL